MRTGERGLFLYNLLLAGLSRDASETLEREPGFAGSTPTLLEHARDEGRFEGLVSPLELLPAASRRVTREAVTDEARAACNAGPSDHVFRDESLRAAKAAGVIEGKRDGVLVLLHGHGLSLFDAA